MHPSLLQAAIDFRELGLSPELFSIGPFALRWYALSYVAGILLAWWYVTRLLRAPAPPATATQVDELVTWCALGIIGGGRLAYVLFYEPARFAANPIEVFYIWQGGMAFHGGAVGVGVAILLYARNHGLDWLRIIDYVACAAPIGLFLGRVANFVNGELYGRATGSEWGVIFPAGGPAPRHPSQLYEAGLEGLVLFAILAWLFWRTSVRLKPGFLAGAFLVGYGVFRFIVELFREPDAQLGILQTGLTMGQTLCLPMLAGGAWLMATAAGRRTRVEPIAGPLPVQ